VGKLDAGRRWVRICLITCKLIKVNKRDWEWIFIKSSQSESIILIFFDHIASVYRIFFGSIFEPNNSFFIHLKKCFHSSFINCHLSQLSINFHLDQADCLVLSNYQSSIINPSKYHIYIFINKIIKERSSVNPPILLFQNH
jgi:hypothetical protein